MFLLVRARVFSQPLQTGQIQRSGENAEDGKSASQSARPHTFVRDCLKSCQLSCATHKFTSARILYPDQWPKAVCQMDAEERVFTNNWEAGSVKHPAPTYEGWSVWFHMSNASRVKVQRHRLQALVCRGHLIGRVRCFYRPQSETLNGIFSSRFFVFFFAVSCPENTLDKHLALLCGGILSLQHSWDILAAGLQKILQAFDFLSSLWTNFCFASQKREEKTPTEIRVGCWPQCTSSPAVPQRCTARGPSSHLQCSETKGREFKSYSVLIILQGFKIFISTFIHLITFYWFTMKDQLMVYKFLACLYWTLFQIETSFHLYMQSYNCICVFKYRHCVFI